MISLTNNRMFIANQRIKTAFATNDIILIIIHWKISINLLINSKKYEYIMGVSNDNIV